MEIAGVKPSPVPCLGRLRERLIRTKPDPTRLVLNRVRERWTVAIGVAMSRTTVRGGWTAPERWGWAERNEQMEIAALGWGALIWDKEKGEEFNRHCEGGWKTVD